LIDYVIMRSLYGLGAGKYEELMQAIMEEDLPDRCRALLDTVCAISHELNDGERVMKNTVLWIKDHPNESKGVVQWATSGEDDERPSEPLGRSCVANAPVIFQELTKPDVLTASGVAHHLVQGLHDVGDQIVRCMESVQDIKMDASSVEDRIMRDIHVSMNCHITKESLHLPVTRVDGRHESAFTLALKTQEDLMQSVIATLPSRLYHLVKPPQPATPPTAPCDFFSELQGVLEIKFASREHTDKMDVSESESDPRSVPDDDVSSVGSVPTAADYRACRLRNPELFDYEADSEDEKPFRPLTRSELRRVALKAGTTTLSSGLTRFAPKIKYNAPNGKYFTVKQLWECVSHYESNTREFSDLFGGVDCHHIFYEGLSVDESNGTLAANWGS
jgi:hypothetical protein